MANYSNIPGVNMNIQDGQLSLNTTNNTPRILIIGAVPGGSENIPEEPMLISNVNELREYFGGFFVNQEANKLAMEWQAAKEVASNRVYLMALKGDTKKEQYVNLHNQLFGYMADFSVEHVVLIDLWADDYIEGITANDFLLVEDQESFPKVNGILKMGNVITASGRVEGASFPLEVETDHYDTLAIKDIKAGTDTVITIDTKSYSDSEELFVEFKKKVNATPGFEDVVLTNDDDIIQMVSEKEYQIIANGTVSLSRVLKLTGQKSVFKENEDGTKIMGSPAHMLAAYANAQTLQFNNTLAYLGVTPLKGTSMKEISEYTERLIARDNEVDRAAQVIAGVETGVVVPGSVRTQWTSGAAHYAALVSTLDPQIASTNQELKAVNRIRYRLGMSQINSLVGKKYVTFMIKNNAIVVVDGVTTAPDLKIGQDTMPSDFTRLSTLRITNYMVEAIRSACEPFIGKPNEYKMYNSMNTAIKSEIQAAIEEGIIQDAKFSVTVGATLDTSEIALQILPQFELRVVNVNIGLTNPTNFSAGNTPI